MVSAVGAVGSVPPDTPVAAGPELALLKKQLSDCVNCESAKTSQGQAQIAQLSARIAAIQQRQQRAEQVDNTPSTPATRKPAEGPLGTQLDVYA